MFVVVGGWGGLCRCVVCRVCGCCGGVWGQSEVVWVDGSQAVGVGWGGGGVLVWWQCAGVVAVCWGGGSAWVWWPCAGVGAAWVGGGGELGWWQCDCVWWVGVGVVVAYVGVVAVCRVGASESRVCTWWCSVMYLRICVCCSEGVAAEMCVV